MINSNEQMPLTSIFNYSLALQDGTTTQTGLKHACLQARGDYMLGILELPPHSRQRPHYHQFGNIDIFIVIEGVATLHLSRHHDNAIIPESLESYELRPGDTYAIDAQIVHYFETRDTVFRVMNIAQPQHTTFTLKPRSTALDLTFAE
jgi:mannose-6-phosphate isomerase-like protein (cupin superfamily)